MRPNRARLALLLLLVVSAGVRSQSAWADETSRLHVVAIAPGYAGTAPAGHRWTLFLEGFIDHGAADRVTRLIARERIADAVVYFNSRGGHLVTAMALGRLLREHRFETNVGARDPASGRPAPGLCYSACPFAFAGGVRRALTGGSVLGVHRAENRTPVPDESTFQHVVTGQAAAYLAEMGVDDELLQIMSRVPHDSIRVLADDEAARTGLVN